MNKPELCYIGIDGEGRGRNPHNYFLLAASTETGDKEWYVESNPRIGRLTTAECLELIISLPTKRTKIFSYAFNYDLTKILSDVDNETLYKLFRPELRKGMWGPEAIVWCPIHPVDRHGYYSCCCDDSYDLNLQGTKFTISKAGKRVVIWDLIKFFQSKFVAAIEDWGVGNPELWQRMSAMKDKRNEFDTIDNQSIKNYCLEETRCMAQLARKLTEAHETANLTLKNYYGAGSSGAAMLNAMGVKDKIAPVIDEMKTAVASAFFGGRFEHAMAGPLREPLENHDISSAYVYQLAFLPCLKCGTWKHTKKRSDLPTTHKGVALVRYSLGSADKAGPFGKVWGPFPFRTKDGSICFPIESGGGWVYNAEYLMGEKIFTHVRFEEAWLYHTDCSCNPFKRIPEYYNLRLLIGKEGPGIVIKLGMNSCYGKLAQSIGNAIFQSWIWAGMITSGCRAQLLEVLSLHKDPSNCLMFATDGVVTRELGLKMPTPVDTGTSKVIHSPKSCKPLLGKGECDCKSKPLGGWETKKYPKGIFMARPGIYFPIDPTESDLKHIRARGIGRKDMLKNWKIVCDAWATKGIHASIDVPDVDRFCGAKTSISVSLSKKTGKPVYKRAENKQLSLAGIERNSKPSYGDWISRGSAVTFDPMPKRQGVAKDGFTLVLRKFPSTQTSVPYSKAIGDKCPEGIELRRETEILEEQPD